MKRMIITFLMCLMIINISFADDDSHSRTSGKKGINPVKNNLYSEECGLCHFAYFPGLLPSRSWQKLVSTSNLKGHFGEELEYDETERLLILKYLTDNSGDNSEYRRSKKIIRSIKKHEVPIRITETRYIKKKHRKIPPELITANSNVESLSNCDACHKESDKGIFDDDTVIIPGYGKWDD